MTSVCFKIPKLHSQKLGTIIRNPFSVLTHDGEKSERAGNFWHGSPSRVVSSFLEYSKSSANKASLFFLALPKLRHARHSQLSPINFRWKKENLSFSSFSLSSSFFMLSKPEKKNGKSLGLHPDERARARDTVRHSIDPESLTWSNATVQRSRAAITALLLHPLFPSVSPAMKKEICESDGRNRSRRKGSSSGSSKSRPRTGSDATNTRIARGRF